MNNLVSERLHYQRLSSKDLSAFHALITDEHVRRYLLDGLVMDEAWCAEQQRASEGLFAERGVGLWLVYRADEPAAPIGFCGFIRFEETGPEPQLLYALTAAHAGHGYATEIAQALVGYVQSYTDAGQIISAVDEPNTASSRVLEKLGFRLTGSSPGAFGRMRHYRFRIER